MALEIDNISGASSYFYQKIQGNLFATDIAIINTYYPIVATPTPIVRTNVELLDFVAVGSQLKYTNPIVRKFNIIASFACDSDGALLDIYRYGIFKNDVLQGYLSVPLDNSVGYPRNTTLTALVELAENDLIEVRILNTEGTQGIIVYDMLLTAISI